MYLKTMGEEGKGGGRPILFFQNGTLFDLFLVLKVKALPVGDSGHLRRSLYLGW